MRKVITAVTACVFLYGCNLNDDAGYSRVVFDTAAFDRALTAWNAQGITSYTFEASEFRAGPQPAFRVTVENGETVSIELDRLHWSQEMYDMYLEDIRTRFATIPAIFDWISDIHSEAVADLRAGGLRFGLRIGVTYNAGYHFPQSASFGTIAPGIVCGWSGFEIREFRNNTVQVP